MEKNKIYIDKIISQLSKRDIISPFLFLGENIDLVNENVLSIAKSLCLKYEVPIINIFTINNNWEKIKISQIKDFLSQSYIKTPYKFQIFLIENISRMTIQSANSCLKIFEEPWNRNIIFLTNKSESGVLDTILSRVNIERFNFTWLNYKNNYLYSIIDSIINKKDFELIKYFFSSKFEKNEYISFLNSLLYYLQNNMIFLDLLEELSSDLYSIEHNSVNIKYISDKYILKIIK